MPVSVASHENLVMGSTTGKTRHSGGLLTRKQWIITGAVVVGIAVIAGAVAGGVVASKSSSKDSDIAQQQNAQQDAASSVVTQTRATETSTSMNALPSGAASSVMVLGNPVPVANVTPLRQWDWLKSSYHGALQQEQAGETDIQGPMQGFAVGNWLVLENWMYETWFNASAGNDPSIIDEWGLTQHLGTRAQSVFEAHWDSWVTEDHIETMHKNGMNMCRIPVGHWAFIPAVSGEPYLSQAGQVDRINRLLEWLHARGMYAIIDMHAMPGSQNGEITSGHKTSNPNFFTEASMKRSDETIDAVLAWYEAHPYKSVIAALGVVNEPRPYTRGQVQMLEDLYARTYDKASKLNPPLAIQIHSSYVRETLQVDPLEFWRPFFEARNPALVMLEDHPYPGTFPLQNNAQDILSQVCRVAASYSNFPAPVAVTEWSVRTGITDAAFEREFFARQLVAWSQSGGGIYWNHRAENGSTINVQYSYLDLLKKGSIPVPSAGQNHLQYLKSLGNPCGEPVAMSWAASGASRKRNHAQRRKHRS